MATLDQRKRSTSRRPAAPVHDRDAPDARIVQLVSADPSFDRLQEALSSIGYDVVRTRSLSPIKGVGARAAVLDDAMPGALDLCRSLAQTQPVVLVAADRSFERGLAAARAGVSAVATAPADAMEIADWLEELIGERKSQQISVLIVDDDEILAEAYAWAFKAQGVDVHVVSDPRAALAEIGAHQPDILLLDMQMPEVDGLELARIIRQSRKFLSLPIVFLSAERDPRRQLEARRLGGDDFIMKPVDLRSLVALVRMRAERAIALRAMMERDSLTGLLNHARFKERLGAELERCRRSGAELSLAILDIDHFKPINDTHGHLCGDRVIRAMAHTLAINLRRSDVIGRIGGEEFAVLMLDAAPREAVKVADKLRQRFAEIDFSSAVGRFRSSFSGGVAGSREHDRSTDLLTAADAALYAAKRGGRNMIALDEIDLSRLRPALG